MKLLALGKDANAVKTRTTLKEFTQGNLDPSEVNQMIIEFVLAKNAETRKKTGESG